MADISNFLRSVKLPVMPEVAQALVRTLNQEDVDIATVRDVIAMDPALTTTLLRMANSALFGLSRSVSTLDSAVSVVGMSQIRARALAICMSNVFALPSGLHRLTFWRESMACAGYAKWLAGAKGMDENQAWLTGMMLRLGELVIGQHTATVIEKIERLPRMPGARWQREREACGFDEGQITAEVAQRWDFPAEVVQALAACAHPLQGTEFSKLAGIVHLAALLTDHHFVKTETLESLPQDVVHKLGLNLQWMAEHLPNAEAFSDISMLQS